MAEATRKASRTARVLDPAFVTDIHDLSLKELRRRRNEALAERDFLSYLRRLVQVRWDLLVAETERRRAGGAPGPLVDRLAAILAEGPGGETSRGEAVRVALPEEDVAEAERVVAAMVGPGLVSRPQDLTDDDLERGLQRLEREERGISADRLAVFRVHDRIQDELKRRYRDDPSSVLRET